MKILKTSDFVNESTANFIDSLESAVYDFCYRCEQYGNTVDYEDEMHNWYDTIKENWTGLNLVNDIRVKKMIDEVENTANASYEKYYDAIKSFGYKLMDLYQELTSPEKVTALIDKVRSQVK